MRSICISLILNPVNRRKALSTWLISNVIRNIWKALIIASSSFVIVMCYSSSAAVDKICSWCGCTRGCVDCPSTDRTMWSLRSYYTTVSFLFFLSIDLFHPATSPSLPGTPESPGIPSLINKISRYTDIGKFVVYIGVMVSFTSVQLTIFHQLLLRINKGVTVSDMQNLSLCQSPQSRRISSLLTKISSRRLTSRLSQWESNSASPGQHWEHTPSVKFGTWFQR